MTSTSNILIFKPEEVASCLFLVGRLGLKATPAYILAAYIHHNFQSGIVAPEMFGAR